MTSTPTNTTGQLDEMVNDYCELLAIYDDTRPGSNRAGRIANEMQRIYEQAQDMGLCEIFCEAVNAR